MRTLRRAAGITLLGAALLLALPGAGLAQDPAATYTDGAAQLLVRVGAPIDRHVHAHRTGVRDATAGTLDARATCAADGAGTLSIVTPNVAGTHAAAPKPPRGAAVTYRKVHGPVRRARRMHVTWADLSPDDGQRQLPVPQGARCPPARKARYAVAGTFTRARRARGRRRRPTGPDAGLRRRARPWRSPARR